MFKFKCDLEYPPMSSQNISLVISRILNTDEIRMTKYPQVHPTGLLRKREIKYFRKSSNEGACKPNPHGNDSFAPAAQSEPIPGKGAAKSLSWDDLTNPWAVVLPMLSDEFLSEQGVRRTKGADVLSANPDGETLTSDEVSKKYPWVFLLPLLKEGFLATLGLEFIPQNEGELEVSQLAPDFTPASSHSELPAPVPHQEKSQGSRKREGRELPNIAQPGQDDSIPAPSSLEEPASDPESGTDSPVSGRRRGRKPENRKKPDAQKSESSASEAPTHRGRKPKAVLDTPPTAESSSNKLSSEPKRRGRKPGSSKKPSDTSKSDFESQLSAGRNTESANEMSPERKRRGRKPGRKPKTESLPIAPIAEPAEENTDFSAIQTGETSGDPEKQENNSPESIPAAPKKRGRKPGSGRGRERVAPAIPELGEIENSFPQKQAVRQFDPQKAAYKQTVLSALREYRNREGLGSWGRLAKKAGVSESYIRHIFDSGKAPYWVWIAVGKALGLKPEETDVPRNT